MCIEMSLAHTTARDAELNERNEEDGKHVKQSISKAGQLRYNAPHEINQRATRHNRRLPSGKAQF